MTRPRLDPFDRYAGSLRGVARYALDRWRQLNAELAACEINDALEDPLILGALQAYASVLRVATGRDVGREQSIVAEIVRRM